MILNICYDTTSYLGTTMFDFMDAGNGGSFGLPKWVAITTFAPCCFKKFNVGNTEVNRLSFVMVTPSLARGTFRSSRNRTFFLKHEIGVSNIAIIIGNMCLTIWFNVQYKHKTCPFKFAFDASPSRESLFRILGDEWKERRVINIFVENNDNN
jgi:hypothetical protein